MDSREASELGGTPPPPATAASATAAAIASTRLTSRSLRRRRRESTPRGLRQRGRARAVHVARPVRPRGVDLQSVARERSCGRGQGIEEGRAEVSACEQLQGFGRRVVDRRREPCSCMGGAGTCQLAQRLTDCAGSARIHCLPRGRPDAIEREEPTTGIRSTTSSPSSSRNICRHEASHRDHLGTNRGSTGWRSDSGGVEARVLQTKLNQ